MKEARRGKAPPTSPAASGKAPDSYHPPVTGPVNGAKRARGRGRPLLGADAFLDLAGKDCGDGPLDDVSVALRALTSGQTLEVRTADDGVSVALVAWCRLAGHTLLARRGGRFLIQRAAARVAVV